MQAQTFSIFQRNEVSVDVVATSEVSISLTLDPSKIWGRDLASEELEGLKVNSTPRIMTSRFHADNQR